MELTTLAISTYAKLAVGAFSQIYSTFYLFFILLHLILLYIICYTLFLIDFSKTKTRKTHNNIKGETPKSAPHEHLTVGKRRLRIRSEMDLLSRSRHSSLEFYISTRAFEPLFYFISSFRMTLERWKCSLNRF